MPELETFPSAEGTYTGTIPASPQSAGMPPTGTGEGDEAPNDWRSMTIERLWEQYSPQGLSKLPPEALNQFPNELLLQILEANHDAVSMLPVERLTELPASVTAVLSRDIELTLHDDGAAVLTLRFEDKPDPIIRRGTWKQSGRSVSVLLNHAQGADQIVFDLSGDHMVANDWNRGLWGAAALQLTRR